MLSVDKVSNFLGDRKEEVVTTPLLENKSSTKEVDKSTDEMADMPFSEKKSSTSDVAEGTDELVDIKQAVVTIRRKGFDKFKGQSKGYTRWFKPDSGVLKQHFLQFIHNSIKIFFRIILRIKKRNCIQCLLYH